ncbi:immunity protein Imm33 domain-containing protein [Xanthomonas sacchari]|uniref:immunity protein Imm33 domain-containing protein n=1 Tax=Xanthomonas sacchari TaxID=56458 RepID=UPI003D2F9A7C
MSQIPSQTEICKKFQSLFDPPGEDERVDVALSTLPQVPLNALRHPRKKDTCGWYVWGGELSDHPDLFQPLHVHHLVAHVPSIVPYLALGPGWRVLLAPGHVDVWYDTALLAV